MVEQEADCLAQERRQRQERRAPQTVVHVEISVDARIRLLEAENILLKDCLGNLVQMLADRGDIDSAEVQAIVARVKRAQGDRPVQPTIIVSDGSPRA